MSIAVDIANEIIRNAGMVEKHDVSGTPSTVGYMHGPGGLLSFPGVDPVLFNTQMGGKSLLGALPTMPSVYDFPTFTTITGVTADSGAEPTAACANAPEAGLIKGCTQWAPFGRYERQTTQLDLGRVGHRNDRADPMDLRLVGSPLADTGGPFATMPNATPQDVLVNEISARMWARNVSLNNLLKKQLWRGNPANNAAGGQGYKEFPGLALLVNTGYTDFETNSACPAMDSYVMNYNYGRIDTTGANIVAAFADMFYQLQDRAERMNLDPVRWVIVMRPQMFFEVTKVWPCAYYTYRCVDTSAANGSVVDATETTRLRDQMRAGSYLLIDGQRVDVIQDSGILEKNGNSSGGSFPRGCFSSDIYILPMSVIGGTQVTYLEYFQWNNPSLTTALGMQVLARIEGAFLTWPSQTNLCVKWQTRIEPRVVLRTPFLAGRIQNVVMCPVQHVRDEFPEDPYLADGGKTSREGPSYYAFWKP